MPAYVREKAAHVNEALLRNIKRAFDAGVKIAGGSDAGTPFNLHEDYAYEVELMHSLVGMTPHQALHAATNVAAELLGLHRGILAAGEPADLLLLGSDAGKDPRAFRNVGAVIKDGAIVVR
jgi:imidazolonepropionase-like amidohydrolase